MRKILALIVVPAVLLSLSACSEVEYASHLTKEAMGTSESARVPASAAHRPLPAGKTSEGLYKVGKPYKIEGQWYYPKETYDFVETGIASWYGPGFDGKRTASGETFRSNELTAAHRTLQMPSLVRVTNLDNGRSVIVRVNDRGPYKRGRVIDVSAKAAELLAFKNIGTAKVKIELLPEESVMVANMAKSGQSTKGVELAANQGRMLSPSDNVQQVATNADRSAGLDSVPREHLPPGHTSDDGRFMPDPVVTQMPVTSANNIYVQAGAFTVYDNAVKLRDSLGALGDVSVREARVNGQQFYRVRIGPLARVDEADSLLNKVVKMGQNNAIIVVD